MTSTKLSTQLSGTANLALLAPVKPGFVKGFESITYARRLEALLKTLDAIRHASREAAVVKSPFPDAVGRWGILHSFRYTIVPPEVGSAGEPATLATRPPPGVYRLSLNVTFDGGWEPYMRVIYRGLGPLLDAIFCNCTGYPLARSNSFIDYMRWVRANESPGGLYYTESAMTVSDQRYLGSLEKLYRSEPQAEAARLKSASFSLKQAPDVEQALKAFAAADPFTQMETLKSNLKALKALYDLRTFHPRNGDEDDASILLFAKSVMPEFIALLKTAAAQPDSPFKAALEVYERPISWISEAAVFKNTSPASDTRTPAGIQAGIVSRYEGVTHGCLVLLRITDAQNAKTFLSGRGKTSFSVTVDGQQIGADDVRCNLAFTLQGLQALGVPAEQIDLFPHEFIEGMEMRAGLLGDVHSNHPSRWRRPIRQGSTQEVDLGTVHVVVQLRIVRPRDAGHDLHPRFTPEIAKLETGSGLHVLSVEAMRSYPETLNGETITREHFGFRDGISQPVINDALGANPPQPAPWSDDVKRGEIFLGYPNGRQDEAYPPKENALLDNGTFLVLRKMRQHVGTLQSVTLAAGKALHPGFDTLPLDRQQTLLDDISSHMVGRTQDGQPLAAPGINGSLNNFDYSSDTDGQRCPFQSHARRSNPRSGLPVPRIVRRGMSYGPRSTDPTAERGIYFMAYCASIAEQFEIIQRWVAGGNSTGILSTHSDPLLGVPQAGELRSFQYLNQAGEVATVDLGDKPLTELQWGMYLFAPSQKALSKLVELAGNHASGPVGATRPGRPTPATEPVDDFDGWRRLLEDRGEREKTYQYLRAGKPVPENTKTPYGTVVASQDRALKVLQDGGSRHSVCGYGRRMRESISLGYLGIDPGAEYSAQAPEANAAIAEIKEEDAFAAAVTATTAVIDEIKRSTQHALPGNNEIPLNIVTLSEYALGSLCTHWFGLPDPGRTFMDLDTSSPTPSSKKAVCPQNFFSVARYLFWPHPSEKEAQQGQEQGRLAFNAVKAFLAAGGPDPMLGELSRKIAHRLAPLSKKDPEVIARTIAGVMLGFPPTVHQNFLRVMTGWIESQSITPASGARVSLWDLQADLLAAGPDADYATTANALRGPLLAQMRRNPAPEMIWREDRNPSKTAADGEPDKTVVWLTGVMMDPDADDSMMFGGRYNAGTGRPKGLETVHGCPGYEMAIGVLLGMVSAILRAGTLRPTPSSTVVNLMV